MKRLMQRKYAKLAAVVVALSAGTVQTTAMAVNSFSGTVTSVWAYRSTTYAGAPVPVRFQMSSAPGAWIRTNGQSLTISAVINAMKATNYASASVTTDDLTGGNYPFRVLDLTADQSTTSPNRVSNLLLMAIGLATPDSFAVATMGDGTGGFATTPEQAGVLALARIQKKPVTYTRGCAYILNQSTNQTDYICNLFYNVTLN